MKLKISVTGSTTPKTSK